VVENATYVIKGCLAQVGVALGIVENIQTVFDQELMEVQTAARSTIEGFGHECDGFALRIGQVLRQVLDHQGSIRRLENVLKRGFDFAMPRAASFMVMVLNFVAEIFHHQRDLVA